MKRPIALLASLLAVTVLATAAAAAGGDSSDPLISLNYLQTVFTAKANSSIDASLDKTGQTAYTQAETLLRSTVAAAEANVGAQRADVFTEARLKQGDMLSGPTGLQVIVLAGNANVQFSSGAVIDVTTGSEVSSGASLAENHRYLVAEDTTALFAVTGKTAVLSYRGLYSLSPAPSVDYPAMAAALKTISLFRGSDTGYGEGFDLEKAPTRMEALIMLIRLLGEEKEALSCTASFPFTDIPDWAEPYAAYGYSKGYTNGVDAKHFGPNNTVSAAQFESTGACISTGRRCEGRGNVAAFYRCHRPGGDLFLTVSSGLPVCRRDHDQRPFQLLRQDILIDVGQNLVFHQFQFECEQVILGSVGHAKNFLQLFKAFRRYHISPPALQPWSHPAS